MKTILNFLSDKYENVSEISEDVSVPLQGLNEINRLYEKKCIDGNTIKHLRIIPKLQKNQIWTIKNEYEDFMGLRQKTNHPFIVILKSEPSDIEDESFVRINVVSPFIELASMEDIVCNDASIVGFPFLIETWNDQPILSEILDEYLGYYEINEFPKSQNLDLTIYQFEFREIEISRAKYLNNSVTSLLAFLENRQATDSGVIISLMDEQYFPNYYNDENEKESEYALASRSGIESEDKFFHFKANDFPFEIYIRKNESGYIITVFPFLKAKLYNSENKEMSGYSNTEKTVFEKLKKGLYIFKANKIQKPIKIRLN